MLFAATKTFNLAGLGGSLAVVPNKELRERLDAEQRAIFAGIANAVSVAACEAAWRHGEKWLVCQLRWQATVSLRISFPGACPL